MRARSRFATCASARFREDSPFVTDGSVMASASFVCHSITYLALTARAADNAVDQLKQRNIQWTDAISYE